MMSLISSLAKLPSEPCYGSPEQQRQSCHSGELHLIEPDLNRVEAGPLDGLPLHTFITGTSSMSSLKDVAHDGSTRLRPSTSVVVLATL
jgi:hypothetical protein